MSIIRTKDPVFKEALTLKQKREIVQRFKASDSMAIIAHWIRDQNTLVHKIVPYSSVEQVIRDFMNGRFVLAPQKKRRK